jgi:anti-sigma regulatory factor (Ser/Thr protein kinase)
MKLPRMNVVIESRLDCVALAGNLVRTFCEHAGASPLETGQIELCVVESMNNCIIHSYELRSGHRVRLCVSRNGLAFVLEIHDWGTAMNPMKLTGDCRSMLNFDPKEINGLAENGRGLHIIQSIMDTVEYSSAGGANRLKLTKTLLRADS